MMKFSFIKRNEHGTLEMNRSEWLLFRDSLLAMAKTPRELEFIGQLIEDLEAEYEEKIEDFEDRVQ